MKKEKDNQGVFSSFLSDFTEYMSKNYPTVILIFTTFLVSSVLVFVKISTSPTISSFHLKDYEVGQVSDVTIEAKRSLPPDNENPVSIERGEKVIRKGFPITPEGYAKLKKMSESPIYIDYRAFANSIVYHILLCALFFFFCNRLYFRGKEIELKELITECVFYVLIFASVIFGSKTAPLSSPYAVCTVIPVSLFVFLVSILFGELNAVFFSLIVSLSVLNAASYHIEPFFFVLATSLASTRLVRKINKRTDMILVSALQALLNVVFMTVLRLIFNMPLHEYPAILVGVALNGFFSGILCLGLLTPLELLLNTASLFRLMDMSDLNNPLMKKMLVNASGTYSHSLMVASLAETACNEVGANPLLARVGAYYHDIGKLEKPEYFVENQNPGENIHNEINPSLSVSVIRSHVKLGVEKARSLRFPKQIIDIIGEHHGNQVISFFYNEAKSIDPDANPEDYSYSGNPPSTRESAIVMLADTVEAACRSLEKPSVPRLEKFVSTLISGKIESSQLENCNLTFNDLNKIRDAFVQILAGHYHSRTKYPDQKDPDGEEPHSNETPSEAEDDKKLEENNGKTAKSDKVTKGEKEEKKSKEKK